MADVPGWQRFTKAPQAESALKQGRAAVAKRSSVAFSADVGELRRLERSQAKTPQSMMRLSERITGEDSPDVAPEPKLQRAKEPKYAEQCCRTIDPNFNRAPFYRVRSPRGERKRRPAGWTACWFVLPKLTVEGLQRVAITLAEDQQHSPWPKERRRYARTKSHLVGEALDDFFRKLGFPEFCVEERR
jgi:hypothetical protein